MVWECPKFISENQWPFRFKDFECRWIRFSIGNSERQHTPAMYINSTVVTIEVPRLFELQTHTGVLLIQDKPPPFSKKSNESLFRGEQKRVGHSSLRSFHFLPLAGCVLSLKTFFFESQSQWHVALIARFANNLQPPIKIHFPHGIE